MRQASACSKTPSRNRRFKGMTLVELMLALTLFSAMMGATGALLQAGFRAQSLWGTAVEPAVRLERTLNRIGTDMASAQVLFSIPALGSKGAFEFGRVESVLSDADTPAPEWVRVSYTVGEQDGASVLIRESTVWRLSQSGASAQTREALLPVSGIVWEFARIDKQGQLIWGSAWDGTKDGFPKWARLTCTLPESAGKALAITRVFRNPAGSLPLIEEAP